VYFVLSVVKNSQQKAQKEQIGLAKNPFFSKKSQKKASSPQPNILTANPV
jgi:hypothetical protein